jgi:hypothetical protein
LDPYSWDLIGLAYNKADGRSYAAVLVAKEGRYREYFGSAPLEHHKARRLDQRAGLGINVGKDPPHGYSAGVQASAACQWSNLGATAPVDLRPWQWGLALTLGRSSLRL